MDTDRFALFGQTPAEAAAPRSVVEAQDIVRGAAGQGIVPWGGGTRQHVGYPPERYDLAFSTECLDAITEYQPADLVVTAQAGVTVAQLQRTLAEHGQWLPLDIALPERQTVGGMVAARADSLRRFAFGSVRDALIGVTVINHWGEVVKGGGKVVKNVSGYDLPKLYCGSWGTLGLITDATFKVAPLPEASATALLPLPADRNSEDVLDRLLESELEPSFLYLLNPTAARAVLPDAEDAQYLAIGFDGSCCVRRLAVGHPRPARPRRRTSRPIARQPARLLLDAGPHDRCVPHPLIPDWRIRPDDGVDRPPRRLRRLRRRRRRRGPSLGAHHPEQ